MNDTNYTFIVIIFFILVVRNSKKMNGDAKKSLNKCSKSSLKVFFVVDLKINALGDSFIV